MHAGKPALTCSHARARSVRAGMVGWKGVDGTRECERRRACGEDEAEHVQLLTQQCAPDAKLRDVRAIQAVDAVGADDPAL